MTKHRPDRRLFELLLEVASPALIITMVGSLVFFLVEVFYRGPHVLRLQFIMGLFTIATVLVSRISIQSGEDRAVLFASGLALATFATTSVIVEFQYQQWAWLEPVVIIALIATVMWVSNRLVWDCTLIGPRRDVSAMGLIEAIRQKSRLTHSRSKKSVTPHRDSFNLFQFLLGRNGANTTPGVWVFYLSMAAFAIFGLGQWFYRPSTNGFSVFFLFAVYLASGLGLLLVTSLLGLKRYANKRGATIPVAIAMNWLFVGTVFLIGFMLLSFLLPRPDLSNAMGDYLVLLNRQTKTSELAVGDDNDVPDDPMADPSEAGDPKPVRKNEDSPPGSDAPQTDGSRGDQQASDSSASSSGEKGESDDSNPSGETSDSDSQSEKDSKSDDSPSKKGDSESNEGQADESKNGDRPNDDPNDDPNDAPDGDPKDQADDAEQNKPEGERDRGQPQQAFQERTPPVVPPSESGRGLIYLIVAVGVGIMVAMYWNEILKFWRSIWGRKPNDQRASQKLETQKQSQKVKPFSVYKNPFASSVAHQMPAGELMDYSLAAMRAFADLHAIEATDDLTVEELINAITSGLIDGRPPSHFGRFAAAFNRTLYGNGEPSDAEMQSVQRVWQFMESNAASVAMS